MINRAKESIESDKLNDLLKLKQEFSRYFFSAHHVGMKGGFGFNLGFLSMGNYDRNKISAIIDNRVYLSNLPSSAKPPFSWMPNNNDKETHAALVISCVDISELAESGLLLEPSAKRIQYHVVAMQDVTACVGSKDHIYDALAIMSFYADRNKPIQIHCYSGVGRSAMMTALHLAHRYLLKDPVVTSCVDEMLDMQNKTLHCDDENYIEQLYRAVSYFVLSKRSCCQFDNYSRNELAVGILKDIHHKLEKNESLIGHRDENYCFLAELSQSSEFKKLQHHYYNSFRSNKLFINDFINNLLLDQNDWYRQLENEIEHHQAKSVKNFPADEWKTMLTSVRDVIIRLSEQWPKAQYSKQPLAYLMEKSRMLDALYMPAVVDGNELSHQNDAISFRK